MSGETPSKTSSNVHKLPPWARKVEPKLYWMLTSEKYPGEYKPDDVIKVLVFYHALSAPALSPVECKWTRINSAMWSVTTPICLIESLAQIPGVQRIML